MKKANYFKHFNSLRDEERVAELIMDLGAEGYGLYILILELLNSTETYRVKKDYKRISFLLRISNSNDLLAQVVESYGLFDICDQGLISSKEMDFWMEEYDQVCKTNAANRKKGWEDKKKELVKPETSDTTVLRPYKNPLPIEENREEKRKIKENRADERVQGEKGETTFFSECLKIRNSDPVVLFFEYIHFAGKNSFETSEENRLKFMDYWRSSNFKKTNTDIWNRLILMAMKAFNLSENETINQVDFFVKNQTKEKSEAEYFIEFLNQLKSEGFEPVESLKWLASGYLKF